MSTKLSLRVLRVKCVDETNGSFVERFGNDEIALGGFAISQNGDTVQIPTTSIYPSFDDGDVKVFNPPKIFYTFPSQANFPREFGVGLVLIEKDNGGSGDAIKNMTDKVKDLIKAALPAAGGVLGIAINVVFGPFVTWFINKIVNAINDDLFPPKIVTVKIPSAAFNWSGSNHSAEKTLRISGHQGIYELTYDWMFV